MVEALVEPLAPTPSRYDNQLSEKSGEHACSSRACRHEESEANVLYVELSDGMNIWDAAKVGDLYRVQELVREQPELVAMPSPEDQMTALHWAALNNRPAIVNWLLEHGALVDAQGGKQGSTPLQWAASKGFIDAMTKLLQWGANPQLADASGFTALHIAAQYGQSLAVLYLLALGMNQVDDCDSYGRTSLLWAAYRGHEETVNVLLGEGARVDAADHEGKTVLQWAVIKGDKSISRVLLKEGRADPTLADATGKTAWDWAQEKGHLHWYRSLLLETGLLQAAQLPQRRWLFGRIPLPLPMVYWQLSRSQARFVSGRIGPMLAFPSIWLCFGVFPWFVAMLIVGLAGLFLEYRPVKRTICPPDMIPGETAMVSTAQWLIISAGTLLELGWFLPATRSHFALHLSWMISSALCVFWLRRATSNDPGVLGKTLSNADDCREMHETQSKKMRL